MRSHSKRPADTCEAQSSRSKDHEWGAEQEVREYLADTWILREHFARNLSAESVGEHWSGVFHELVAADEQLPQNRQRVLSPRSWVVSVDVWGLVVWPPRGLCFEQGATPDARVLVVYPDDTGCRVQVCDVCEGVHVDFDFCDLGSRVLVPRLGLG